MTIATTLPNVSSTLKKPFEKRIVDPGTAEETSSNGHCRVYTFEDYTESKPASPPRHVGIGDLVKRWEQDSEKRAALEEGRRRIAETCYPDDGDTVRTLRLRKGWSQTRLAEALATSQSHIARIERGTENLTIQTCRKLAAALGLDLNALNQALERQEANITARMQRT